MTSFPGTSGELVVGESKMLAVRGKRSCGGGNGFRVVIVLLASRLHNNIIGPPTPLHSPLQRPWSHHNDHCIPTAFFPPPHYLAIYISGTVFRFRNLDSAQANLEQANSYGTKIFSGSRRKQVNGRNERFNRRQVDAGQGTDGC